MTIEVLHHVHALPAAVAIAIALLIVPISGINATTILEKVDFGTVLAALVGVAGYILDARNGRQTEVRAAHSERASNQMANLLVPLNVQYQAMISSLCDFLDAHWSEANVRGHSAAPLDSSTLDQTDDADAVSRYSACGARSFRWIWSDDGGIHQMARAFSGSGRSACCRFEVPQDLEEAIRHEPESPLAVDYRAFVRNIWIPGVQRIAEIVDGHCHLMEAVPVKRLEELFGPTAPNRRPWTRVSREYFYSLWLNYARGWESMLKCWDDGDFSEIRPQAVFPVGLFWVVVEGQDVVSEIQKDLTGQSQMHGSRGGRNILSERDPSLFTRNSATML